MRRQRQQSQKMFVTIARVKDLGLLNAQRKRLTRRRAKHQVKVRIKAVARTRVLEAKTMAKVKVRAKT